MSVLRNVLSGFGLAASLALMGGCSLSAEDLGLDNVLADENQDGTPDRLSGLFSRGETDGNAQTPDESESVPGHEETTPLPGEESTPEETPGTAGANDCYAACEMLFVCFDPEQTLTEADFAECTSACETEAAPSDVACINSASCDTVLPECFGISNEEFEQSANENYEEESEYDYEDEYDYENETDYEDETDYDYEDEYETEEAVGSGAYCADACSVLSQCGYVDDIGGCVSDCEAYWYDEDAACVAQATACEDLNYCGAE